MQLEVDQIEQCERVHVRAGKPKPHVVERYSSDMSAGHIFPPIVVYQEKGTERFVVADGWHRLEAAKLSGFKTIEVDLRVGDEADALEFALSCNYAHGWPRSEKDLEKAVSILMTNAAMKEKYRTHQDRADLLKIGLRQLQRYVAKWRDSDTADPVEKKAKKAAKKKAAKHTPKKKPVKKAEKPKEQDDGWTKADEDSSAAILDALADLGSVWQQATRPAQLHTMDVIRQTVREMS